MKYFQQFFNKPWKIELNLENMEIEAINPYRLQLNTWETFFSPNSATKTIHFSNGFIFSKRENSGGFGEQIITEIFQKER